MLQYPNTASDSSALYLLSNFLPHYSHGKFVFMHMDSDSDVNFYDDSVSDNDVDSYDHSVSEDDVDSHDDLVSDNDIDFHDDSICDEDQKMKNYTILSTRDMITPNPDLGPSRTCLGTYISTAIDDGPRCLLLRCPDPSCTAAIGVDMVNLLVSHEYKEKFQNIFVRSYVERNSKLKWCPAPDCDAAIEYNGDGECGSYEVVCGCSYKFCWRCSEDGHRPVDCDTMCKHEFCWTCLGPWSEHTHCNAYKAGQSDETRKRIKNARASLERYTHYYERWDANHKSRIKAQSDLKKMETKKLDKLCKKFAATKLQLTCVVEACQQIIECRRALKWSYAYGYFIPEDEPAKARLFEYLQGAAEAGLERLHQCAEKELLMVLKDGNATIDQFQIFRVKLVELTNVM
ncbi:RBR-type E3 ubiquitin transferase [Heracleum sosnowskyi]|uniref:RBR-type E3 ubiquitin transferase n=1 Tax=Heracleum sosnowskyi TaxID=360622 RepID=A0AAD8NDP8_9APIA|nr:RBR-type E3 ubiquitin transferase [Heracleum sosnowskyi]